MFVTGKNPTYTHKFFLLMVLFLGVLRDGQSIPIWQLENGAVLCQHLGKAALKNTNVKYSEKTVEERMLKAWRAFGPDGPGHV